MQKRPVPVSLKSMTDARSQSKADGHDGPLVGILLAAGRGSRFDAKGQKNKLLALVNGQAVAVQSASNLRAQVDQLIIVIKPDSAALRQALSDIDALITECTDADLGMGHSLAHGVQEARNRFSPRAVVVALADMPFVTGTTLQGLVSLAGKDDRASPDVRTLIAAPRYQGQRGHPVLFGSEHFDALQASHGDTGAPQLLRAPGVHWLDVADAGVLRDIDRPADLPEPQ